MAKLSIKSGTTSKMVNMFVQNSSVTTGAGLTGLSNNSSGLLAHFIREGESSSNPIAVVSAAIGTWTTGGFVEIESSAMPGLYQIGLPNAVCSANAKSATVYYFGATNMAPVLMEIELTATDNQDAVRGGMTSLPNAAAQAANGLITNGTGAFQISTSAGMVLVQRGSAAGQLDATAGVVNSTVITNNDKTGYALTQTFPANFSSFSITAGGGVLISSVSAGAMAAQSISSVTGAVGSVTASVIVGSVSAGVTMPSNVTQWLGTAVSANTAGFPAVDVFKFGNTNVTARDIGASVVVGSVLAAASNIKKNTALAGFTFLMTDSTNHAPVTGKTVAGSVSLNGGAFNALTNTPATEIANGWYQINLAAADLNGNTVALRFTAAGSDDRCIAIITQA